MTTSTPELIAALRALAANLGRHPGAATATEAADRLEALIAPVEGMTLETTDVIENLSRAIMALPGDTPAYVRTVISAAHDLIDRLSSALTAERAEKERLAGALQRIIEKDQHTLFRNWSDGQSASVEIDGPLAHIARAALSQEKQP